MRNILVITLPAATLLIAAAAAPARAADWVSAPSYFTHDPNTGERCTQYAPVPPAYASSYQKSVMHYTRSSLQVGSSIDMYHQIDEYGRPVRPYAEWQYPYRPYSVPYQQWGPPYGGLNIGGYGYGYGIGGGYGGGGAYQRFPNFPGIEGFGQYQPWFNGYFPNARPNVPFPNPNIFPPVPGGGVNVGPGNSGNVNVAPGDGNTINN